MVNVEGKWTLVTGASRGIGREIALFMAKRGSNVIVHSRDLAHTTSVVKDIEAQGVKCLAFACELADEVAVRKMADEILAQVTVDILFNNAGIKPDPQVVYYKVDAAEFLESYKVNTIAPMILIEKFLPGMLEQQFGRIINSTSGMKFQPEFAAYASSQGANDKLAKNLSAKLAGTGVLINIADPGWIKTELGGKEAPREVTSAIPGVVIGAFAEEEDINGAWIPAQAFRDMNLEEAVAMAPAMVR